MLLTPATPISACLPTVQFYHIYQLSRPDSPCTTVGRVSQSGPGTVARVSRNDDRSRWPSDAGARYSSGSPAPGVASTAMRRGLRQFSMLRLAVAVPRQVLR